VKFYPLGTFPEQAPEWFSMVMEPLGADASRIPVWHLGTAEDLSVPAAFLLRMPPGYVLFRHGHPCKRFEVVVQGTLEVGDGRIARPGDTFTAEPGELYGPHTAGPEGCTTFEIFSALEGMFRVLYEDPDGTIREAETFKGELPPEYVPLPTYDNAARNTD
jgi:hypothetical protein